MYCKQCEMSMQDEEPGLVRMEALKAELIPGEPRRRKAI